MNTNLWDSIQPALKNSGKILLVSAMTVGLVACGGKDAAAPTSMLKTPTAILEVASSLCVSVVDAHGVSVGIFNDQTAFTDANEPTDQYNCAKISALNKNNIINLNSDEALEYISSLCTAISGVDDNLVPNIITDVDGNIISNYSVGDYKYALDCPE